MKTKNFNAHPAWMGICCAVLACGAAAETPPPAGKVTVDIKSQPIGAALNQLAQQAGIQVLFYSDVANALMAPALTGTFTPEVALALLLSNTGLTYSKVNERTVAIHRVVSTVSDGRATRKETGRPVMRLASNLQISEQSKTETSSQDVGRKYPSEERRNRTIEEIIAITTALWSAAVTLCGMAGNFLQLLMIRIGVAVGEAGCIPPAHSLIADHFTRAERPKAVARYMLGAPLAMLIGYFLAGWLNEFYGWRATFMSSLKEVCMTLWAISTFRHLLFCFAVASFFGQGILQWQPAFFIRSYGLETGALGTWFAVIWGVGGLLGTYWGGELAYRHAVNNERLQLKAMAVVYTSFGAVSACIYLSPNPYLAFALMGLAVVGITTVTGPLFDAGAESHARHVDCAYLFVCQSHRHGIGALGCRRGERCISAVGWGGVPALCVAGAMSGVFLVRMASLAGK